MDFQSTFLAIRKLVAQLSALPFPPPAGVERFGLAADGGDTISLIPLHGIDSAAEWRPIVKEMNDSVEVQGMISYLTTMNAPEATKEHLMEVMNTIRRVSGLKQSDVSHHVDNASPYHDDTNLFARLLRDEIPSYRIREDAAHAAFLTPYTTAKTVGYSIVIPRRHHMSDVLAMTDEQGGEEAFLSFVGAAWDVTKDTVEAFKAQGVERCGIFMEGYEINWAHIKVIPVWPVMGQESEDEGVAEFTEEYAGYLTTQKGSRVADHQAQLLGTTAMELKDKLKTS